MLEFTFRMFAEGDAALPARGMGAIPMKLASRLPDSHESKRPTPKGVGFFISSFISIVGPGRRK